MGKIGKKCAHFSSPRYDTVYSTVATENVIPTENLIHYINNTILQLCILGQNAALYEIERKIWKRIYSTDQRLKLKIERQTEGNGK